MLINKYHYKILPDRRLIIKYFRGSFTGPEFIDWMEETGRDSLYDATFNVINDFYDVVINPKIGEINELIGYVKGRSILYGERKSVFLTENPDQTVFTMMLGLVKHDNVININTFSTLGEALKWIGLPLTDLDFIRNCISDLKKII